MCNVFHKYVALLTLLSFGVLYLFIICYTSLLQITFSSTLSREFHPYKPDPSPLLHICILWEVQPNEVKMIRDSLKDDVSNSFLDNLKIIQKKIIMPCTIMNECIGEKVG